MAIEVPKVPQGNGKHPVLLVVLSTNDMPASTAFYAKLFGWHMHAMSPQLTAAVTPAGPTVSLRSDVPEGFQAMVPFIGVRDVKSALRDVVANGGSVEREPWNVPMVGTLARFKDASGTIYGLTSAIAAGEAPSLPMPMGSNPQPPAGTVCHLEMYASDGTTTAGFFEKLFGWGTLPTMPQYMAFNPGAGIGGIFQSHTPTMPAVAYVYCTDVSAKLSEIEAAGGARMGPPISIPGALSMGYFKDPCGMSMGLIGGPPLS